MKYPITPEYLDSIPSNVVRIYQSLEDKLIEEICSRLRVGGVANEVVLNDIRVLRERGISQERIDSLIMEHMKMGRAELEKIYADAVEWNQRYYDWAIDKAVLTEPVVPFTWEAVQEAVDAIARQTSAEFENLTQTTAFSVRLAGKKTELVKPQDIFYRVLDDAEIRIRSGGMSYNEAIAQGVKQLADSGLRRVDYESGHSDQLDVAVRRAVITGISQMSDQYAKMAAERLETHYWEISAHSSARDKPGPSPWSSHKDWQGKVYSERSGDIYPNIYTVCGLGEVDGLGGANCRHRRYPFVLGVTERSYTDAELEHIDDGLGCDFEGKKYTAYEATQMQRRIERTIRAHERERLACEKSGLEDEAKLERIRLRRLRKKYKAFSEAAGLPQQRERMKVQYLDDK